MATTYLFDVSGATDFTSALFLDKVKVSVTTDGTTTTKTLSDLGATLSGTTVTIPGYGTITAATADAAGIKALTLNLTASAPEGTYSLKGLTSTSEITTLDAGKMTNAFTLGAADADALATLVTGAGADSIDASSFAKLTSITTNAGNDTVKAAATATTIALGAGDDNLTAAVGNDADINAGEGNDTLVLSSAAGVTVAKAINLGAGDDSVSLSSTGTGLVAAVTGFAGKDTMTAGASVNATFTGGADADTFVLDDKSATISITDYNYAQGDVVRSNVTATDTGDTSMTETGGFVLKNAANKANVVTAQATMDSDNVYRVLAYNDKDSTSREIWTAAASALTGVDAVTMDLSKNTTANYQVDAGSAVNANITLGSNAGHGATVTLGSGASTLTVGKAEGDVRVYRAIMTGSDKDTVFNFTGDVTITDGVVASNGTSVKNALKTHEADIITYTANGNTTTKVKAGVIGASVAGSNDLNIGLTTTSGVLDKYINLSTVSVTTHGIDASKLTSAVSIRLNNDEGVTDKYKNIFFVKGGAQGGTFVGANSSTEGVASAFNLAADTVGSQLWAGGSKGTMAAALGNQTDKKAKDTIWFGTTDAATNVTNFEADFTAVGDVAYLYDVSNVKDAALYATQTEDKLTIAAKKGGKMLTTDQSISDNGSAQVKVMDSTGTINYVAVGSKAQNDITIDADDAAGVQATYVVGENGVAAKNTVQYNANTVAGKTYNIRLNNDALAATTFYDVDHADLSGVKSDAVMTVVGANDTVNSAGSHLKLGGKQTDVWGGGSQADAVTLSAVEGASNTVWYGKTDGLDTVVGIDAASVTNKQTDTIYFYDEASLANVMKDYKITNTAGDSIVFKADDDNTLTLKAGTASSFYVQTQAGKVKAAASSAVAATNTLTYATDTNLYLGDDTASKVTTLSVSGTTGATIRLNNDDGVNYYKGIDIVDAGGVTAGNVVLVGAGESSVGGSQLKGGYGTQNDFWGGSKAADKFTGRDGITDVVWFDAGDGGDTFGMAGKEDKVYMYNTSSIDKVSVEVGTLAADLKIVSSDGDALTITGASNDGSKLYGSAGITVGLNDGSNYYIDYNSATSKYSLVKKA